MTTLRAALFAILLACVCAFGATAAVAQQRISSRSPPASHAVPQGAPAPEAQAAVEPVTPPELSPRQEQVRQIAERNGEKEFLMVDKARGEILLFENAQPIFRGMALTGAALGDRVPPIVLTFSANHPMTLEQKVTPAGRFTVRPEADPEYGKVWTITEVHGKDWDFAIHQVYLGTPSEHRDTRIHSQDALDHHITFGCINVERSTIQLFLRTLPRKTKVPLYILPQDESLTASLFPVREAAPAPTASAK